MPTPVPSLQGVRIRSVSAGFHTLAVSEAGALFSFGGNANGQLGHGDAGPINVLVPKRVEALRSVCVAAVSAGTAHSLVLAASGGVYTFGYGGHGRLGHCDKANQHTPKRIEALQTRALSVSAGDAHSLVLDERGTVHTFGYGANGRLGHGNTGTYLVPTPLPGLVARAISVGDAHSLVLARDGSVLAFGDNTYAQLGLGDRRSRHTPTRITGLPAIQAVAAGGCHSLILTCGRAVYSFGSGGAGQLGHGEQDVAEPTEIEALRGVGACMVVAGKGVGPSHSLVAAHDCRVLGFGYGRDERLGLGLTAHQPSPTEYPNLKIQIPRMP